MWLDWGLPLRGQSFMRLERHRLLPEEGKEIDHIARPASRWVHDSSIWQDGERFDIWINWDDCVRIEHDGKVILRMWAPAGEILRAIEHRRKARG
jgi:hypothetical protein